MLSSQIIEADLTWCDGEFKPGVRVQVDAGGRIGSVGQLPEPPTRRLRDRALLPGMINAHSHAFQRGLRGRGETFPAGAGDFWSWREAMYDLVERLDEHQLYEVSRQAFAEMLRSGITTVGEFHYLHHDTDDGYRFDEVVLRAARDAGIRIVLLNTYYRTGGLEQPLQGAQRRFGTASLKSYWRQMDHLAGTLEPATQKLGAVAHSIRAAPLDEIRKLWEESQRRHLVFHMHVEEQPREIEDCLRVYGKTPLALLNEQLTIGPAFTAVHCTHTASADHDDFVQSGGNICICPVTEANLGDGLANVPRMVKEQARICLGTDSNARISFFEEMRWLEYAQRLVTQTRGVCRDQEGRVGRILFSYATVNGARSLGLKAGLIRPGYEADLVAVDLTSPALAGWTASTLMDGLVLGTGNESIAEVIVGGSVASSP